MKYYASLLLGLLFSINSFAQVLTPIKWEFSSKKVSDTEYDLVFSATVEPSWHLYSTDLPEGGPNPTTFKFKGADEKYDLVGGISHRDPHEEFDANFDMTLKYFSKDVDFTQRIKLKNPGKLNIDAEVEWMACDDHQCLPPDYLDNTFTVGEGKALSTGEKKEVKKEEVDVPKTETVDVSDVEKSSENTGLLRIFFLAFLGGFAALLTPCVFPMIPMTVSFFTKQSKTKAKGISNAIIYGLSIIGIYVILGVGVSAIFGADALNALSTNVWFNLGFFLLLVVFAFSFFGAFEIVLPNKWLNAADKQSDKGGYIGIFFMAFTLALVSFSCTGPIVGTLLVDAAVNGGVIGPMVGMLGFSLALALPFGLFAAFPGWMNSLPKSGGWLNSVKVVLGFLELAFAFKFLSAADMVLQLHWLERELFLAIWIVIFGMLGFYLLGKIKMPHDSPSESTSITGLVLGIVVLSFTVYMIPGLWGAPTKLISGFPPPQHYSESPFGFGGGSGASKEELPEHAHYGPQNIVGFDDYEAALKYAKEVNKPLLLDFTGWGCVNCRKMEDNVWSDSNVKSILSNDVVLVSLYVDEKEMLPESEQYVSEHTGKKVRTIGNKWSDFQIKRFNRNAQPFYVLEDLNGNVLNTPRAYDTNVEAYTDWLHDGIDKFKSSKKEMKFDIPGMK
ncbi:MAG: cytochrome c biogenesis protein CcdA [Bacteroidota bacterium]